jgi:hypothetical protein
MYVPNLIGSTVSVIDTTKTPNTVATTVATGLSAPHTIGIAHDPVDQRMYVTSSNIRFDFPSVPRPVTVIDTNTNTVVGNPIPVGIGTRGIAYDPEHGRMYVVNSESSTVSVIQITTAAATINSAIDGNGSPVSNGGSISSDDITFTFSGTATTPTTVASFECRLDNAAFAPCTSPLVFNNVPPGSHTFQVRAVDESGNRQVPSTSFSWQIVAPPIPTPPPDSACGSSGGGNTRITGTSGADTLIGTSGINLINGLAGNDAMNGCSGNDQMNGGADNDGMAGSAGNDIMHGNDGDDIVQGGSGNDRLLGDGGVNTLTGGIGRDQFVCGPNGDTITDFELGQDARTGNCILGPVATSTSVPTPFQPATTSSSGNTTNQMSPPPQSTLISLPLP